MFFKSILQHVASKVSYLADTSKFHNHDQQDDRSDNPFCDDDDDDKHGGWGDRFDWKSLFDRHDHDKDDKDDDKDDDDDDDKHHHGHGRHDWHKHHGKHDRDDDDHGCNDDDQDTDEPTYDKVFFGSDFDDDGNPVGGYYIQAEEPSPNPYNIPSLPEGTDPTFANYVSHFESIGGDITQTEAVVFYENDDDGTPQEAFRIEAPDGGFKDSQEVIDAYEDALDENDAVGLMVSLSVDTTDDEDDLPDEDDDNDDDHHAEDWAA